MKNLMKNKISEWLMLAVSLAVIIASLLVSGNAAVTMIAVTLGALAAVTSVWALTARDASRDHWTLAVIGLMMVMVPLIAAPLIGAPIWSAVALVSWIGGAVLMLLGGAAYTRNDHAGEPAKEAARLQKIYEEEYREAVMSH